MLFKLNILFLIFNCILFIMGFVLNCVAISAMISREEEKDDKD